MDSLFIQIHSLRLSYFLTSVSSQLTTVNYLAKKETKKQLQ